MTPVEIAYFKHFMYDKGLLRNYLHCFRHHHTCETESVEQFFLQTSVKDVIMNAFTFYTNTIGAREDSTFDYWKAIDDQWQQYIGLMADNKLNDSWPELSLTFSILRQNWDVPLFWNKENFESTEEVYQRMNIGLPLPECLWEHGSQIKKRPDSELLNVNIFDVKDGDIFVRIKKDGNYTIRLIILFKELNFSDAGCRAPYKIIPHAYYNVNEKRLNIGSRIRGINFNPESHDVNYRLAFPQEKQLLTDSIAEAGLKWDEETRTLTSKEEEPAIEESTSVQEPLIEFADDTPGIEFVEFDKNRRVANALNRNIISVNTRNHSWRVTINRTDTKEIKKKHVRYAMVGNTKTGETMIMLCNNDRGVPISYNSDDYYNINSRQFCAHLKRLLSIYDDFAYLRIEKVSEKMDSITYKVTKQ